MGQYLLSQLADVLCSSSHKHVKENLILERLRLFICILTTGIDLYTATGLRIHSLICSKEDSILNEVGEGIGTLVDYTEE